MRFWERDWKKEETPTYAQNYLLQSELFLKPLFQFSVLHLFLYVCLLQILVSVRLIDQPSFDLSETLFLFFWEVRQNVFVHMVSPGYPGLRAQKWASHMCSESTSEVHQFYCVFKTELIDACPEITCSAFWTPENLTRAVLTLGRKWNIGNTKQTYKKQACGK